jgi:hypothetical protein
MEEFSSCSSRRTVLHLRPEHAYIGLLEIFISRRNARSSSLSCLHYLCCRLGLACCICMHARLSVRTQDPGWMWYLTRVHITLINYVRIAVEDQSISNYPCLELDRFSCIWFLLPESRNKSTSAWVVQNQTTLGLKIFRQKYQHLQVWGIPKV